MNRGPSPARAVAWAVQLGFGSALVASHFVTESPYVYPHYVLLILLHPALLDRGFGLRIPPWQVVYVSFALFAHPIGGLYGFYASVWWFDHLTHTLSATLVAAIGYTLADAARRYAGGPRWLVPAFAMAFVLSAGLLWEFVELHVDWLTVYSYNDTLLDYVFNTLGGLLVVIAGPRVLSPRTSGLAERIEAVVSAEGAPDPGTS